MFSLVNNNNNDGNIFQEKKLDVKNEILFVDSTKKVEINVCSKILANVKF